MPKVIFEFESEKVAEEFASWMCEQGEQDYWAYIELVKGAGDVAVKDFDYGSQKKGDVIVKCKEEKL